MHTTCLLKTATCGRRTFQKKLNLNFIFIESMRVQMSTTWKKKFCEE